SPAQILVLGGFALPNDMGGTSDISISYRIERLPNNRSRLLVRSRYRAVGRWAWFYLRIVEVLDSLTTIAQLRGIQQRAEHMDKRPVITPVPLVEIDNSPSQFHPASNHY